MFRQIMYILDYPVKFVFVNSRGNALIELDDYLKKHVGMKFKDNPGFITGLANAKQSKKIYETQIRRYFGLGFIASFFPGTEAYTARREYFQCLLVLHDIWNGLDLKRYMVSYEMALTPFYFLTGIVGIITLIRVPRDFIFRIVGVQDPLWLYLPFVMDILYWDEEKNSIEVHSKWYMNLLYSLLNPFGPITVLLSFLYFGINALIEFGGKYGDEPSIPQMILKGINMVILLPFISVANLLSAAGNLVLLTLDTIILDPLRFAYEVVKQIYDDSDKEFLYVPHEEFEAIKDINAILQEKGNESGKEKEKKLSQPSDDKSVSDESSSDEISIEEEALLDLNEVKSAFDNQHHLFIKTSEADKNRYQGSVEFYKKMKEEQVIPASGGLKSLPADKKKSLRAGFDLFEKRHPELKQGKPFMRSVKKNTT